MVLGGLNLTAVYKPSFYGFVLPALLPLIVRVALAGDPVHVYTALVMTVVLGFVLGFGHHLNDVLTHSLAIRYENVDLIGELKARTRSALEARDRRPRPRIAPRASCSPRRATTCASRCTRSGCTSRRCRARARDAECATAGRQRADALPRRSSGSSRSCSTSRGSKPAR